MEVIGRARTRREAHFALDGLSGLHEGEGDGVLAAARAAVGPDVRIGVERTRFGAWLAAGERRSPAPVSTSSGWIGMRAAQGAEAPLLPFPECRAIGTPASGR